MSDKDPLSSEVAVRVSIEDNSLALSTKSRAFAALDRFVGGIIDLPNPMIEGFNKRRRLKNELRESMFELANQKLKSGEIDVLPEAQTIIKSVTNADVRRAENRIAVAMSTVEHLGGDDEGTDNDTEISDDWLNKFERYAEDASSEEVRDMWGRLLAGEIRAPGSVPLSTMRVMAEIDREVAQLFEQYLQYRTGHFIVQTGTLSGPYLRDVTILEEAGLLSSVTSERVLLWEEMDGAVGNVDGDYLLKVVPKSGQKIRPKVITISRAGLGIANLLPENDTPFVMREIFKTIEASCQSAQILRIQSKIGDNRYSTSPLETLK